MIGKLILLGIAVAAIIVIAPSFLKGSPHAAELEAIKNRVDNATHDQLRGTSSIGLGGVLAGAGSGNDSKNQQDSGGASGGAGRYRKAHAAGCQGDLYGAGL